MKRYLKLFRLVAFPLYFLSFLFPRDKGLWLFGTDQNRFDGNAKALFLYASGRSSTVRPVWISGDLRLCRRLREQGFRVYFRWGIPGLWTGLRAGYYFYNSYTTDINFYTSGGATLVNLWHGIPLKQIEFDIRQGPLSRIFHTPWKYLYMVIKPYMYQRPSYVLATSEETAKVFASAFRVDRTRCLPFGYPRNDILFQDADRLCDTDVTSDRDLCIRLEGFRREGGKVLFYMPTWRSDTPDFLARALPDLDLLNQTLHANNQIMVIKLHPNTAGTDENFSQILFMDPLEDIYPLLPSCDMLLTDYSSIYFDFLLLDREIIFYPFDFSDYIASDRALYYDYDDVTPGEKAMTFPRLLKLLERKDRPDHTEERRKMKKLFFTYADGDASHRVYSFFREG